MPEQNEGPIGPPQDAEQGGISDIQHPNLGINPDQAGTPMSPVRQFKHLEVEDSGPNSPSPGETAGKPTPGINQFKLHEVNTDGGDDNPSQAPDTPTGGPDSPAVAAGIAPVAEPAVEPASPSSSEGDERPSSSVEGEKGVEVSRAELIAFKEFGKNVGALFAVERNFPFSPGQIVDVPGHPDLEQIGLISQPAEKLGLGDDALTFPSYNARIVQPKGGDGSEWTYVLQQDYPAKGAEPQKSVTYKIAMKDGNVTHALEEQALGGDVQSINTVLDSTTPPEQKKAILDLLGKARIDLNRAVSTGSPNEGSTREILLNRLKKGQQDLQGRLAETSTGLEFRLAAVDNTINDLAA